jgi:hypothetical protein
METLSSLVNSLPSLPMSVINLLATLRVIFGLLDSVAVVYSDFKDSMYSSWLEVNFASRFEELIEGCPSCCASSM